MAIELNRDAILEAGERVGLNEEQLRERLGVKGRPVITPALVAAIVATVPVRLAAACTIVPE